MRFKNAFVTVAVGVLWSVPVQVGVAQNATVTLQEGVNGYNGCIDKAFIQYVERNHPSMSDSFLLGMNA